MATATKKEAVPSRRRRKVDDDDASTPVVASSYFARLGEDKGDVHYISSGCAGFDAALGGGWPLGRTVNIVGDKSAGKTLLAIEACANFHRTYPKNAIRYAEAEAAFDKPYAAALGMPVEAIEFSGDGVIKAKKRTEADKSDDVTTVEELYEDIEDFMARHKGKGPMLYVLDSLDSLSDQAEMERGIGESSYGGTKPKKLGEMFRRLIQPLEEAQCLLVIISQLRDKLGVTFGETKTRSGGKALDFYASQIIWLAEIEKIKRTVDKIERVVGVQVRARVKKNKVGLAYREFEYPILFGYGIDDLTANIEWLLDVEATAALDDLGISKAGYKVRLQNLRNKGGDEVRAFRERCRAHVFREWQRIETKFLPQATKY